MRLDLKVWKGLVAALFALALVSVGQANVWIDENFDGTVAAPFTQGNGTAASGTFDRYDGDALNVQTTTLLTHTGSVVTSKSFNGSSSYQLDPGETFAIADGYDGQAHGDWIYFQYAINVDPIPATAGNVATWTYTNVIDGVTHVINLSADADGAGNVVLSASGTQNAVPIAATGGITTVGTLTSASQWVYLTIQLGVTNPPQRDVRDPNQTPTKAAGAYFFASSNTASVHLPFTGGAGKDGGGWSLSVNGATTAKVYIDDLYWEGAREDATTPQSDQYLRPFNYSSVEDWRLIQ